MKKYLFHHHGIADQTQFMRKDNLPGAAPFSPSWRLDEFGKSFVKPGDNLRVALAPTKKIDETNPGVSICYSIQNLSRYSTFEQILRYCLDIGPKRSGSRRSSVGLGRRHARENDMNSIITGQSGHDGKLVMSACLIGPGLMV